MTWLARMEIDVETAAAESVLDTYGWHQKLWECFPEGQSSCRDFLTRVDFGERTIVLWVLTRRQPLRPKWCPPARFAVKTLSDSFLSHTHYAFDLRACPTKAVVQRAPSGELTRLPSGKRSRGRRQPVVDSEELRLWLERKGIDGGFIREESRPLEIGCRVDHYFRKPGHSGVHGGVQFRGVIRVTDSEKFKDAYYRGIGSAKGFGFGLLLLAPINLRTS